MLHASDRAAKRFLGILLPHESFDYTDHPAKALICTAFSAYQTAWRGNGFAIGKWEYPFTTLEKGEAFEGDQPWAVLFRHAVALARPDDKDHIALIWSVGDVKSLRPDLIDAECRHVLAEVLHTHDAEVGVTWETIGGIADTLYSNPFHYDAEATAYGEYLELAAQNGQMPLSVADWRAQERRAMLIEFRDVMKNRLIEVGFLDETSFNAMTDERIAEVYAEEFAEFEAEWGKEYDPE